MPKEACPGTTYEMVTTTGSQSRSLYQASRAAASPGVVCNCDGTQMDLNRAAGRTESLRSDGHHEVAGARTLCCKRAQAILNSMRS